MSEKRMMREAGGAPGIFYWLPHSIRAPTISARRFRSRYALPRHPRPLRAAYLVLLLNITHLEQTASLWLFAKREWRGFLRKTVLMSPKTQFLRYYFTEYRTFS
jgi:hypothetical protein